MFRASICPSSLEQKPCYCIWCILLWFCWMWLVTVVGRCHVGFEHDEGFLFSLLTLLTMHGHSNLKKSAVPQFGNWTRFPSSWLPQFGHCTTWAIRRFLSTPIYIKLNLKCLHSAAVAPCNSIVNWKERERERERERENPWLCIHMPTLASEWLHFFCNPPFWIEHAEITYVQYTDTK